MKRREFITLLGGAAAAWPLAARAQQPAMPVIGYLNGSSAWEYAHLAAAFREGLSGTGYVEGRNVLVEYRWAENHYERLPTFASDLVRRRVTVIAAAGGNAAVQAAKTATTTIPIVFSIAADPIESGFVASLSRPGGNLTGATTLGTELAPKRLELMRELRPAATLFAVLVNPTNPNAETTARLLQAAAHALGVQAHVLHASADGDLDKAFESLVQLRAGGLVINSDAFLNSRAEQLAALALRRGVPAIFGVREFAAAGGLMSYGGSIAAAYRQVGVYTGRILKGERPADLPVMQATKVELIINLKSAKALGLTVPLALLGRADEVIE